MSKSIFRHQGLNVQTTFVDYDPDIAILTFMDDDSAITDNVNVVDNKGGIEIEENPIQRRCKTDDIHPSSH